MARLSWRVAAPTRGLAIDVTALDPAAALAVTAVQGPLRALGLRAHVPHPADRPAPMNA